MKRNSISGFLFFAVLLFSGNLKAEGNQNLMPEQNDFFYQIHHSIPINPFSPSKSESEEGEEERLKEQEREKDDIPDHCLLSFFQFQYIHHYRLVFFDFSQKEYISYARLIYLLDCSLRL